MPATIKDVAREAGVSIATVSKVLNHKPSISEATVQRVEEVMKRLDYAPNSRAASLARRSTRNIIYLTSLPADIAYTDPHMFDILCGVQNVLMEKGYSLTLMDTHGENEPGMTAEQIIMQKSADGMIIHGAALNRSLANLLVRRKFPHIIIGHPAEDTRLCWVDTNHLLGGQIAAEHLLERGYREIGILAGRDTEEISNQRLQGACLAMREAGVPVREEWIVYTSADLEGGFAGAMKLLQDKSGPQAVICCSNLLALGFERAAQALQRKIPEDVALITFDKYLYSAVIRPLPTVVHIDVRDMGRAAGKMLLRELKKPDLRVQSYTTLPELLIHDTTPLCGTGR